MENLETQISQTRDRSAPGWWTGITHVQTPQCSPFTHHSPLHWGPKWQILLRAHSQGLVLQRLPVQDLGRGLSPSQLREMSSTPEPQLWPFLQPAQSLGGMIQQRPGSHQVLLQPESSEVSLGSLADLCNQGEVVWGARRTRCQICSATGNGGELSCLYWVWETRLTVWSHYGCARTRAGLCRNTDYTERVVEHLCGQRHKEALNQQLLCRFHSSSYFTQKQYISSPSSMFSFRLKFNLLHRSPLGHY